MASKKDNLPLNINTEVENTGTITYANEVIAIIAGVAANEVEGIAGMCTAGGISDILGRNRNITKGVKVEIGTEEASVDLYVIIEYGTPIQKAASDCQENVRKAIETMTGLHVVRVDVHVQGVSFEQENKALQSGQEVASIDSGFKPLKPMKVELVADEDDDVLDAPKQEAEKEVEA
ncbi:MAG: Asp23/Gls24 family envelope stress response protein [Clostridia bacterium]|nr:Asp23/Gls24 family envelope stress response protein [Clostridia bacterium]